MELYIHFPSMTSWRGAVLKHRDNFTFYLIIIAIIIIIIIIIIVSWYSALMKAQR